MSLPFCLYVGYTAHVACRAYSTLARSVLLKSKIFMLFSNRSSGAGNKVELLDPMRPSV